MINLPRIDDHEIASTGHGLRLAAILQAIVSVTEMQGPRDDNSTTNPLHVQLTVPTTKTWIHIRTNVLPRLHV